MSILHATNDKGVYHMENFMMWVELINAKVNGFVWGVPAMVCIIGVGL